jgi:LmbE family N-acetylglucosaminyl deacetylase
VDALGVNTRVLLIAAHPDDEDTFLIAWLSRGRHVETAYLSLTRGDGGQNLIGNELGEALGVIRTEELLAARRVDGAQQFFTRAFDFGFSKDTLDTFRHWPRDSILGDVVQIVRAFRPHVIYAVFSGTPRDGHGHHQVSGLLAREAYRVAGDTVRFPTSRYGPAWTPLKLYGNARYDPTGGETMRFDVGEYSPLLGRSYAEIAGESRSQHKSQGFGAPQRKGPVFDMVRREATRVNESTPPSAERSMFDGIDTTWARFRSIARDSRALAALDSIPATLAAARRAFDAFRPASMVPLLVRALRLIEAACPQAVDQDCVVARGVARNDLRRDMGASFATLRTRLEEALWLASGLDVEAIVRRETSPLRTPLSVATSLYNRGADTVWVSRIVPGALGPTVGSATALAPAGVWRDSAQVPSYLTATLTQPAWLVRPRIGDLYQSHDSIVVPPVSYDVVVRFGRGADTVSVDRRTDAIYRFADPIRGEIRRSAAIVPAIAVTLGQQTQYVPANTEFTRDITVRLQSADERPRDARVRLLLPPGVVADSATRSVRLSSYDASATVSFRIRGRLPAGTQRIAAVAESDGGVFDTGYQLIDYDHIRRQRVYRPAVTTLSVVDMRIPSTIRVAYVSGVGDNVAPTLAQLGIPVTIIPAAEIARADLQPYTTVVIGPRAYEAHPELAAANPRLFDFARRGGTLVVQYGQNEMTQPGVMPFPITLGRPADRVTNEDVPVTIEAPNDKLLRSPNAIGAADFAGWVQERSLYMPRTFDERYRALLSMNDPGEPPNRGAILVTPLGQGMYVYTTLSFFRQLPAGVPGPARLFLNLLAAGIPATNLNP